jgi:hypothetical protein
MNKNMHMKPFAAFLLACVIIISGCQKDILKEDPQGFLSPNNTFKDKAGFESALAHLYRISRATRTVEMVTAEGDKKMTIIYGSGTDLGWYWDKKLLYSDYALINPTDGMATDYWNILFGLVKDCNVIISRLKESTLTEGDRQYIGAHARFFRAYAYRFLAHLYGDVPKIEDEITSPKDDYVRTPKSEILAFMIADLEFATKYLPVANGGVGKLSKAAADHLLAETYISAGDHDKAIEAATRVISDPQRPVDCASHSSARRGAARRGLYWRRLQRAKAQAAAVAARLAREGALVYARRSASPGTRGRCRVARP